jgi:hypothetical protein
VRDLAELGVRRISVLIAAVTIPILLMAIALCIRLPAADEVRRAARPILWKAMAKHLRGISNRMCQGAY